MTAPTVPQLDQTTVEDITLPCDWTEECPRGHQHGCEQPAEWIARTTCRSCLATYNDLLCDAHHQQYVTHAHHVRCGTCQARDVTIASERL